MSALSACFPPQVVLCLLKLILGQEDKTISFGDDIVVHVHPQHCFMLLKILRKMFFFCGLLASSASRAFHRHEKNTWKLFANNISEGAIF